MFPFFFMFIGLFFFYISLFIKYDFKYIWKKNFLDFKFNSIFFFQKAWYIDYSILKIFSSFFIFFVNSSFYFDKGIAEWFGPFGISKTVDYFTQKIEKMFNVKKPSIFSTTSILFTIHLFFLSIIFFI
jgi:hypothetical protein